MFENSGDGVCGDVKVVLDETSEELLIVRSVHSLSKVRSEHVLECSCIVVRS